MNVTHVDKFLTNSISDNFSVVLDDFFEKIPDGLITLYIPIHFPIVDSKIMCACNVLRSAWDYLENKIKVYKQKPARKSTCGNIA